MKNRHLHSWDVSENEAIAIQNTLSEKLSSEMGFDRIEKIAGADVFYFNNRAVAGIVIFKFPGMELIEKQYLISPVSFPYVPGLLSFREGPVLLKAFQKIRNEPDVIIFDGHGIAHPRRMGIAAHLGILLDRPTIGCAKSILVGEYAMPDDCRGEYTFIRIDDEIIGAAVRTKKGVKPVFVSPGNRMDLQSAVRIILECAIQYRVPEPIRQAHAFASKISMGLPAKQCEKNVD